MSDANIFLVHNDKGSSVDMEVSWITCSRNNGFNANGSGAVQDLKDCDNVLPLDAEAWGQVLV